MSIKSQNQKIIFGLKVKQLRTENKLSFAELSKQSGMSVSYLNEIEKGKKFPKEDKIEILAQTLDTTKEELLSDQLMKELAPVGELLRSNFLNELPLDLFGIELSKVTEIIASSPIRVGAFISTLVEISRNYALLDEHFFNGAMRAYQEMRYNYFEEIEAAVDQFLQKNKLPFTGALNSESLKNILQKKYKYEIVEGGLDEQKNLQHLRSVFIPKQKRLLLKSDLEETEKIFQFSKECAFNFLKIKERGYASSLLRISSFDEVLNHYKALYFSAAIIIPREEFTNQLRAFFQKENWNAERFLDIMKRYNASPEIFYQRLTNILPQFFGLQKMFFLRCIHHQQKNVFEIDKEMHLNHQHHPHGNGVFEHYCRRWLSISLLKDLFSMQKQGKYVGTFVGAQRSNYFGTEDEYLCISLARPSHPSPGKNTSTTIGILMDDEVREKIKFWNDPTIHLKEVNKTCERCPIEDCTDRVASATVIAQKEKRRKMQEALDKLIEE